MSILLKIILWTGAGSLLFLGTFRGNLPFLKTNGLNTAALVTVDALGTKPSLQIEDSPSMPDISLTQVSSFAPEIPDGQESKLDQSNEEYASAEPNRDSSVGIYEADPHASLQPSEVVPPQTAQENTAPKPASAKNSEPLPPVIPREKYKVIISEIQAEGQTAKDEFITLYNPNPVAVNLEGFSLKKKTATGNESNLVGAQAFSGTIPAQSYFLIAPKDNSDGTKNYLGSTEPDIRYSGNTFSFAANNTILLYDYEGALLDKVGFGSAVDFETAAAPNPAGGQSIFRSTLTDSGNNAADFKVKDYNPILQQEIPSESLPQTEPLTEPPADLPAAANPSQIVINEISWMGSSGNANAEWLEIFNQSEDSLDLSGWTLAASDGTPTIMLSGIISGHGFYLLERTSDDTVPAVIANQIYTGALGNSGEDLSLIDNLGNVIDRVNCLSGWFAGDNATKQTMQRKSLTPPGNESSNWQTSGLAGGTPGS